MPGVTPAQSRHNHIQWLDTVALSINLQYSFIYDENNQRVPGVFQHLSSEDAVKFKWILQSKTRTWVQQAFNAETLCGDFLEVWGGQGSGKGTLFMSPFKLGPFFGQ